MIRSIFFVLVCSNMLFAQLLENQHRVKSKYADFPNFMQYNEIVKKEKNKNLYQIAHESFFAMDSAVSYTLSGRELRAINMAVADAPSVMRSNDLYLESVYIYKINSKILYICIDLNENEYFFKKNGKFDNTSKSKISGSLRGDGGGEYLINLKTMTIIEKKW